MATARGRGACGGLVKFHDEFHGQFHGKAPDTFTQVLG